MRTKTVGDGFRMIKPDEWIPAAGLALEPNALTAATSRNGNIALMAGPGAGKTEVLAQRADFLLRTGACPYPKRILAISFKKDAAKNLKERVMERCGKELAARFDSYTFHAYAKQVIDIFRPYLSGRDALDENYTIEQDRAPRTQITFNDLVPLANQIVDNFPAARNSIRQTYTDVFLDEFQDCTDTQYSLIKNAFYGTVIRLVAVGDTKQVIMGWAGALEGIFLEFGNDFGTDPLNLYQNFRSLPRIRRVHNSMLKDVDPQAAVDDEQLAGDEGIVSHEEFSNASEEALWIADSIESWAAAGTPLSEIAILCNTQPHLYAYYLMEELDRRNIPFRNEQVVQDLFCEPIYTIIVDYMLVLLSSSEPDSWERLFSTMVPEFIDDTVDAKAREFNQFLADRRGKLNGVEDFSLAWETVEELIQYMGNDAITSLSHDYENKEYFKNLVGQTKAEVENAFNEQGSTVDALKHLSEINAVRILTIHKCKGLEFDTVVVQGIERQTFFSQNQEANQCAYFVAISRAKRRLVVTTSAHRTKLSGANQFWRESRTPLQQYLSYVEPHVGGD